MKKKVIICIIVVLVLLVGGFVGYKLFYNDVDNSNDISKDPTDEIKDDISKKIINIYYDEEFQYYTDSFDDNSVYKGKITCNSDDCEYVEAFNKYVVIKQNEKFYLYDYLNDSIVFDSFTCYNEEGICNEFLTLEKDLIGIYYSSNNEAKFYSLKENKSFSTIKGSLLTDNPDFSDDLFIEYNMFAIGTEEKNYFINLNNGKVIFENAHYIEDVYEDEKNKILYIVFAGRDDDYYYVHDQTGKNLYNKVNSFEFADQKLFISYGNNFEIRDDAHNLIHSSKKYDQVLDIYNDYAVVLKEGYLKITDMNDQVVATFEHKWDTKVYEFHSALSGWYTENNKNGIYLVIENLTIPYGTKGSGLEFYYIPSTKETGIIETNGVGGYAKPILYLYPTIKTNVVVKFDKPSLLTTTYPKFKNEWNVMAHPNGDLYDANGNYYYALYWEEEKNHYIDFKEGFYVEKENAINFLEDKLSLIGLNEKERNEFIMYWLPILEKNGKNLVYFELTEERDSYNKLIINPKPDSLLRVAIHVKKVNEKVSIKEQKLISFARKGFVAVEWGGVIY